VRLQERGHRAVEFHSLFRCVAICCSQVPNTPHSTAALGPLRGRGLLPSLRKARTWLHASTSNCGIRVQQISGTVVIGRGIARSRPPALTTLPPLCFQGIRRPRRKLLQRCAYGVLKNRETAGKAARRTRAGHRRSGLLSRSQRKLSRISPRTILEVSGSKTASGAFRGLTSPHMLYSPA